MKLDTSKKKSHTVKTEIRTILNGETIHIAKLRPGSIHNFDLHKQEPPLHSKSRAYVDLDIKELNNTLRN